jgi:ABC-type amino acid transport substrate-binding protein
MNRLPFVLGLALCFGAACSSPSTDSAPGGLKQAATDTETLPDVPHPYEALPPGTRSVLTEPFTGDFDEMVKRRVIRVGLAVNRTHYFIDRGVQRGIAYDSLTLFEEELNKKLNTGLLKVHVAFVPLTRDQLFPALTSGRIDLLAAQLTITPERQKLADFSNPTRANVSEILIAGPSAPAVATPDDLSGKDVFVRPSSSYFASLQALNTRLTSQGKPPVNIKEAPENLEDDDILEMVNAGLVPMTIVDDYLMEVGGVPSLRDQSRVRAHLGSSPPSGRTIPDCVKWPTTGSRSTARKAPSAARWIASTSRPRDTPRMRRARPNGRSSGPSSISSASTRRSTAWTSC